jgi:hypothetical protein
MVSSAALNLFMIRLSGPVFGHQNRLVLSWSFRLLGTFGDGGPQCAFQRLEQSDERKKVRRLLLRSVHCWIARHSS